MPLKSNFFKKLSITMIISISIIAIYRMNNYPPDKYFFDNQINLNKIATYVERNHLDGYLFYDDKKLNLFSGTGSIGRCLYKGCDLQESENISLIIKDIGKGIGYNWNGFLVFSLNENVDLWNKEEAEFVYKKGYFKNKIVGKNRGITGDESGILYIFNDDWGVITWCYHCGGGGWD